MPRPPPPADALIITGIADLFRHFQRLFGRLHDTLRARQNRHAGRLHCLASELLQTHVADHLRPRTDKLDAGSFAYFGEIGVLAEKSVAGMNGI